MLRFGRKLINWNDFVYISGSASPRGYEHAHMTHMNVYIPDTLSQSTHTHVIVSIALQRYKQ